MDLQTIFAIIFLGAMALFLYIKRSKLQIQKIFFPLLYFILYRTKLGLDLMDKIAKRHTKLVRFLGILGVVIGFVGMLLISYELVKSLYMALAHPEVASSVAVVLPFETGLKGTIAVPFFYWIISIFVIAVVHEFAHGVVARAYDIKVKSSGFAFLAILLPIIPAAFVEPDEKQMPKRPKKEQLSVLAAGAFSNVIAALLAFLVLAFAITPAVNSVIEFNGIKLTEVLSNKTAKDDTSRLFPAYEAGLEPGHIIKSIDGMEITHAVNFTSYMSKKKPGDTLIITTDKGVYYPTLTTNPKNASLGYLGVSGEQSFAAKPDAGDFERFIFPALMWISGLFAYLFTLNLGIGLFNLVPIGPVDGGRMLYIVVVDRFGKKFGTKIWKWVSFAFFAIIIAVLLIALTK